MTSPASQWVRDTCAVFKSIELFGSLSTLFSFSTVTENDMIFQRYLKVYTLLKFDLRVIYRTSLNSQKSKWPGQILTKINISNFLFQFTIFLILKKRKTNVTPVEHVPSHFFQISCGYTYVGRHGMSNVRANEDLLCQNDFAFLNNSFFPIIKCRP